MKLELLEQAVRSQEYLLDLVARDGESVLRAVVAFMTDRRIVPEKQGDSLLATLLERERRAPTAIGNAIAIPHAYLEMFDRPHLIFVRLARPINLGAPDGVPVRFFFILLGPPDVIADHLDVLAEIARLASDDQLRYDLGVARTGSDLQQALQRYLTRVTPGLRPEPLPDGLRYSGKPGGGILRDIARRLPHYLSDFRDGLHLRCVGATLFLFFACLAPAVTFGGVMAVVTGGQIGAVEMITASAVCGVAFALLSGQPLIILGGTGPLLVFTGILYALCRQMNIPFLPAYAWVGLWTAALLVLLALFEASCLMRYFTRFTDEIFAGLISVIFIVEAVKAIAYTFRDLDIKQHHDTALLSLLLALGTFWVAITLSNFRRSVYLLPRIREFLSDFGPAIAIAAMTLVAIWLNEVELDVLPAPDGFGTTTGRAWLIPLTDVPVWVRFAAIGPALLAAVLLFLDQNITARLINNPDHRLRKGEAYHLDLGLVGLMVGFCSIFGLPWLVAATVRSLNHLRSLATSEEVIQPGGEAREQIIHVRENRVTPLAIHLLVGLALLALPLMKTIPMAVLYGLFLFMGVVSMKGNQLFERLNLWLMDTSLYPTTHYIRQVPNRTIHLFTGVQVLCLGVLWIVKISVIGILFPLFIALLVPVRSLLKYFFAQEHLAALDAAEDRSR